MKKLDKPYILIICAWLIFSGIALTSTVGLADVGKTDKPAPSRMLNVKSLFGLGRSKHELVPNVAISTNDLFYRNFYFGLNYYYSPVDWISFGPFIYAAYSSETALNRSLGQLPQPVGGNKKPGTRKPYQLSHIGLEARWAMIPGKIRLFNWSIVHFEHFILLRTGLFFTQPLSTGASSQGQNVVDRHLFSGLGIGQRYFLQNWGTVSWQFMADFMGEFIERQTLRIRINMAINVGFGILF